MRQRVSSSIAVVLVGLALTLVGGPPFAVLFIALGLAGYLEFLALCSRVIPSMSRQVTFIGYCIIAAFGLVAAADLGPIPLYAVTALAVALPIVTLFSHSADLGVLSNWSLVSIGSLYLGLPVYAAVMIRSITGTIEASWLAGLATHLSLGWAPAPRGLAWALTVILIVWFGDTAAYASGRAFGRRRLAPILSPNKTIEGTIGGWLAAIAIGGIATVAFGLGSPWIGVVFGAVVGLAGQVGDLTESVFKRQARVKDSGTMVPGHGGILDRIDALLFAFPVGFILASSLDWLGQP